MGTACHQRHQHRCHQLVNGLIGCHTAHFHGAVAVDGSGAVAVSCKRALRGRGWSGKWGCLVYARLNVVFLTLCYVDLNLWGLGWVGDNSLREYIDLFWGKRAALNGTCRKFSCQVCGQPVHQQVTRCQERMSVSPFVV